MELKNIFKKTSHFLLHHKKVTLTKLEGSLEDSPLVWTKTYYKEYARFPKIRLPLFKESKKDLYEVFLRRMSVRNFSMKNIDIEEVSKLLYYAAGLKSSDSDSRRFYPSAGARYPLEVYLIAKRIEGLEMGIYHYNVKLHELELLNEGDYSKEVAKIAGGVNERPSVESAFCIVVTAVFGRTEIKYGKTSYRLVLLEAGHLGQNFGLAGTALNLSNCFMGGFVDRKLNRLLNLNEDKEQSIYLIAFGRAK